MGRSGGLASRSSSFARHAGARFCPLGRLAGRHRGRLQQHEGVVLRISPMGPSSAGSSATTGSGINSSLVSMLATNMRRSWISMTAKHAVQARRLCAIRARPDMQSAPSCHMPYSAERSAASTTAICLYGHRQGQCFQCRVLNRPRGGLADHTRGLLPCRMGIYRLCFGEWQHDVPGSTLANSPSA